jgi:hypothetical protein
MKKLKKRVCTRSMDTLESAPITIPDVDEKSFEAIVDFLYTGILIPHAPLPGCQRRPLRSASSSSCETTVETLSSRMTLWLNFESSSNEFLVMEYKDGKESLVTGHSLLGFSPECIVALSTESKSPNVTVTIKNGGTLNSTSAVFLEFWNTGHALDFLLHVDELVAEREFPDE